MFHLVQKCGFNMDSSANATIEATFTPDGQYVLSGKAINFALFITFVFRSFCFCWLLFTSQFDVYTWMCYWEILVMNSQET